MTLSGASPNLTVRHMRKMLIVLTPDYLLRQALKGFSPGPLRRPALNELAFKHWPLVEATVFTWIENARET
jgi:hypothetical protein